MGVVKCGQPSAVPLTPCTTLDHLEWTVGQQEGLVRVVLRRVRVRARGLLLVVQAEVVVLRRT